MPTFKATDGTVFKYEGDMSGEVEIEGPGVKAGGAAGSATIPGAALLDFIGNWVRKEIVPRIDKLSPHDICDLE